MSAKASFHLWDGFATFSRLVRCFYKAARGKRDRDAITCYYSRLEENSLAIKEELEADKYLCGKYRSFYIHEPKLRLIESAPFRDRIVHHALHEVLEPLWESSFYEHSYACRTQ
jgi:RNA-directed DNA polymerase